ncbi:unnamed protein product [Paramecium octaurelia]|uniref:Uncharacterized protein n=1 Tax=Paramecium octaurelia TaxID=43137 RepID=A0A8S1W6X7_PAROT|nr:unnamed protein product [Paramecium octaurelia]
MIKNQLQFNKIWYYPQQKTEMGKVMDGKVRYCEILHEKIKDEELLQNGSIEYVYKVAKFYIPIIIDLQLIDVTQPKSFNSIIPNFHKKYLITAQILKYQNYSQESSIKVFLIRIQGYQIWARNFQRSILRMSRNKKENERKKYWQVYIDSDEQLVYQMDYERGLKRILKQEHEMTVQEFQQIAQSIIIEQSQAQAQAEYNKRVQNNLSAWSQPGRINQIN